MAERILAAMDYLDAHTKVMPQKLKQRALGDIDGKYSVVDPLLEISYYPTIKNELPLTGIKKINPTSDRAAEDIVEADRERMVQRAERARSAPAPFNDTNMTSSARPMTSSSWITGSIGTRDEDRHIHNSLLTSASHASIKRLAFTSPAVKVGPADVRDDIMDEIVNKPLVFQRNNFKSQSAPPSGRISSVLKSAGTRSTKWVVSPKRARTSIHRRRRGTRSWEKHPGPFMTVKVTGKDLWVVSNSTPTSYFNNKEDDGLRETSGQNGTKVPKWEDTAEAVPKAEQVSLPRHERLLGAPAQFAPTIQWLRYDPSAPPRKPPVLTPYKDEGRYYNLESNQCRRVAQHLDASPGVRIARNGEVLSHSMKLESLDEYDQTSQKESDSEGSDIDVASLIPAKLAAKIKRHYGTPENSDEEASEEEEGGDDNEKTDVKDQDSSVKTEEDIDMDAENDGQVHAGPDADQNPASEEVSELSSMSEDDIHEIEREKNEGVQTPKGPMLTKDSLALLTKLAGHDTNHPIVDASNGSVTSFEESLESYELNDFLAQNGIDSSRIANGNSTEQEDVWRILENATPNFWITKSKQQKLAILKRLRRQRKSEQIASTRESLKSARTKEEANEVILPLCWEDELNKSSTKIVKVRPNVTSNTNQNSNTSLPVVFHKTVRYDVLPTATVNLPIKSSISHQSLRPRSATLQRGEGVVVEFKPTRGYRAPVSTPRSARSVRSKSASTVSSGSGPRGHSAPNSVVNGSEIIRQSIDLADLLRVTPDSFPAKTHQVTTRAHSVKREHVTIVHDDSSDKDALSTRNEPAQNSIGAAEPGKPRAGTVLPARITDRRIPAPVGTLNFAGIDVDATTNETLTFSSQRPSDVRSSSFVTPQNTPKAPMIHHSVALTPKSSARGHHPESIRVGVDVEDEHKIDDIGDASPLTSKPMSSLIQEHNGFSRVTLSGRARGGFTTSPMSQNRLKSGSSRGATSHHGISGPRPMKALPNVHPGFTNGNQADIPMSIPAVQLGTQNLTALPTKTADFIQITQSLHISGRSNGAQGDSGGITGNKMYDSYMRELAAHASGEIEDRDQKGVIVGRGLGGTSGKSLSLPRTVKKNLSGYRQAPQTGFTPQAGRRSGLTMVPPDNSQKVGPFGLGVKGDQVRLNIDKNIHNIYRDLGLLKTSSSPKDDKHPVSPGRSHASSARSRTTHKEESVISIPTASDPSVVNVQALSSTDSVQHNPALTPDEAKTKRPSSSNPSVIVQDSGTQWSSRTVKFEDDSANEGITKHLVVNGHASPTEQPFQEEKDSIQKASNLANGDIDSKTAEKEPISVRESVGESVSPTSERSPGRDGVSATESNVSVASQPQVVQRSASETLLDRLAEMGDRDESSDATEEEMEETEDHDVKGVTRVTVNVPAKTESVS